MTHPDTYDYVLIRGNWYLHRNNKDATNNIAQAKSFPTWKKAARRAENTSWEYCQVFELDERNLATI